MSDEQSRAERTSRQSEEQDQGDGATPDLAAVFGRQLQWQIQLSQHGESVIVEFIHIKHARGSARYEAGRQVRAEPLAEQLAAPAPAFVYRIPRAWFADEDQLKSWFTSVCDSLDSNIYGVLTFEIQRHVADMVRFQLDRAGIHPEDKNAIIEDHIEGQPNSPGDIGTREFLRILLAARGPGNESPANEFNLPDLIGEALRNLYPSRLLSYEGVNDYLKDHFPGYAASSGESFRKRCAACGINFMALVREERARRKAEN
jgi:hypothetical protein